MLGFCDYEKVDGISNATMLLAISATTSNLGISGLMVGEESACNLIYLEIFKILGLRMKDLKPCKDTGLLTFINSTTRSYRGMDVIVSLGDREEERRTSIHLLIVPYECEFNDILRRPFLAVLGAVPYLVHLKMKYHIKSGKIDYHHFGLV